jgi:NAD(P)-dependent dehydrogenase (short-subunit alcohol dehydrogenase family)
MQIDLKARTALITGGSKGLGLAIAQRFAGLGAQVFIVARDAGTLEQARASIEQQAPGRVGAYAADVATASGVNAAYEAAMRQFGQVDIVVNNAGVSQAGAFESVTDEIWQADLDLKLFAAIRLSRLVWPQMQQRRWGRIINVLNTGAKAPAAKSVPTSVSRAAGMALTKALAGEGAQFNILVNALLVGHIESDQWVRRARAAGRPLPEFLAELGQDIPMGRVGTADEFASAACFMASDWASYITGTALNVDGGASPVV